MTVHTAQRLLLWGFQVTLLQPNSKVQTSTHADGNTHLDLSSGCVQPAACSQPCSRCSNSSLPKIAPNAYCPLWPPATGGFPALRGFNGAHHPFTLAVVAAEGDGRLPRASTCFNALYLPSYSSAEVLRQRLLLAISAEQAFDEGESALVTNLCLHLMEAMPLHYLRHCYYCGTELSRGLWCRSDYPVSPWSCLMIVIQVLMARPGLVLPGM